MNKLRIVEILELTKQYIIDNSINNIRNLTGICIVVNKFGYYEKITPEENNFIIEYLKKNKPTKRNKYKHFTENVYWLNESFWWSPMDSKPETIQIRIDYLTELINNSK